MRRFRLLPDWKRIATRAWSIRLHLIAGVFIIGEVVLPFYVSDMPRGLAAGLSALFTIGGIWARLVAQPTLHGQGSEK